MNFGSIPVCGASSARPSSVDSTVTASLGLDRRRRISAEEDASREASAVARRRIVHRLRLGRGVGPRGGSGLALAGSGGHLRVALAIAGVDHAAGALDRRERAAV